MPHPYPELTEQTLLHILRRNSLFRLTGRLILLLAAVTFFSLLTVGICRDFRHGLVLLFTVPLWMLCLYFLLRSILRQIRLLCCPAQAEVFRKYGTPAQLAEILSDPANQQVLPGRRVILTRSYLMMRGDFPTYLPLREITGISVIATKGGFSRHVQLFVLTGDGAKHIYRFEPPALLRTLDSQAKEITDALTAHLAQYAPQLAVRQGL